MDTLYVQPIPTLVPGPNAIRIAGGWVWCDTALVLSRTAPPQHVPVADLPDAARDRLTTPRAPIAGLGFDAPRIMGILNTTPDSFSDGGLFDETQAAVRHARQMATDGADILDIGGESTRPGATEVDIATEIDRTAPVIAGLRATVIQTPISIDTRKAAVAVAALDAGADFINDVSAFGFDPAMEPLAIDRDVPACLMHAQGRPETMQDAPRYDSVLFDVYDALETKVTALEAQGYSRAKILVDPGIGFGKTLEHNLTLLRGLSLFHSIGCAILLGASRKGFIGTLSDTPIAADRAPGSIAVALFGAAQGVQVLRVHDVKETRQALSLWTPLTQTEEPGPL